MDMTMQPAVEPATDALLFTFLDALQKLTVAGLAHARTDDPNSYAVASDLMRAGGRLQLRADYSPNAAVSLYVVDDEGTVEAMLFSLVPRVGKPNA